jgi:adenylate kinase family enzyme
MPGYHRIMVMGPPGSGKSSLARRIGQRCGLPVFHLDQAFWRENWVRTPDAVFRDEVARLAALPGWVIDGNYLDTIMPRLQAADALIYLDVPTWLAMVRVLRRIVTGYGRVRPDAAAGCAERVEFEFLRFVWNSNRERRASHLAIVEAFQGRKFILRGKAESDAWPDGSHIEPEQ